MTNAATEPRTLCIDVGGTGLKVEVVDATGASVTERARSKTPRPPKPETVIAELLKLIGQQGEFERISVGFPGVVVNGTVKTAPNLHKSWQGVNLAQLLEEAAGRPVRVCNDADVQGFGDIEGKGVEVVITLGTGVGSAVFVDGRLVPNLELGHQPFRGDETYEEVLGKQALDKAGRKRWRKRVAEMVAQLEPIWNYQKLYIGGGNAKFLRQKDLPENVTICSNEAGLLGGVALWRTDGATE